jgi:hypothetical protein
MLPPKRVRAASPIASHRVTHPLRIRSRWAELSGCASGALVLVLAFAGAAAAGTVSFPITLDPTIPNAWIVAAYVHCGDCLYDYGDEETYLQGSSVASAGAFNLVDGGGGAYAALDYGALGFDSYGFADGAGTGSHAYMLVNVPFSGSGMVTVHFDIPGSEFVEGSNVISSSNIVIATLTYDVRDASTQADLGSGVDQAYECDPVSTCNQAPFSFPIDLSASFSIDQPALVQLDFTLFSESSGFAGVTAHVGLITLDLAPGVTMDGSSGFLSTPGDPHLTPEPSSAWLSLASVAALAALARRTRRLERG